jgi:predicted MFS family arabinose efflux permease
MFARLVWLALGAFAIGTESFMIAPLLPSIAGDLGVTVSAAGALVTVFALTYALGSPILATLTGNLDRRLLLIAALSVFTLANLLAAVAQDFPQLMAARVALALAAGLFMPAANAVAVAIVPPDHRGRALSIVAGGLTVAVALGVPLGAWIGAWADWRATFLLVAGFGALAVLGLVFGLPRNLPRGTATLAQRIAVARRPAVLEALMVVVLWATGAFAVYTFIAPLLAETTGLDAGGIGWMMALFGVAALFGNAIGGQAADRLGPDQALRIGLSLIAMSLAVISVAAATLSGGWALAVIAPAAVVWSIAGWGANPAQAARLVRFAPEAAVVALSLNASALYIGIAAGSALGALTISLGSPADLGWVGALCEIAALLVLQRSVARARALRPTAAAAPGRSVA